MNNPPLATVPFTEYTLPENAPAPPANVPVIVSFVWNVLRVIVPVTVVPTTPVTIIVEPDVWPVRTVPAVISAVSGKLPVVTWSITRDTLLVAMLAENPVALTVTNSPPPPPAVGRINVPWVMNPVTVLPTTLVTVRRALDEVPTTVLPTPGKIPLILLKLRSTVCIRFIVTFTYFTLAGGCGGSTNTIESCWILNAVPGVCTIPFKTIINWFALATILVWLTCSGNEVLSPSNRFDISSILCTTDVRIFSEEVNRFCLNNTSVLLNSVYIGSTRAKFWMLGTIASCANSTDLVKEKNVSLLGINPYSFKLSSPNTLNDAGWTFLIRISFHSLIDVEDLTA